MESDPSSRLVHGKDDALFGWIEDMQQGRDFGRVLDAGTGLHSLRWLATLEAKGLTQFDAITADQSMQRNVQREVDDLNISHLANVLIGNWFPEQNVQNPLLSELATSYDVILADYLIGAMDGFSPYKQDQMIGMLASLLKPGGRLYIVGLQPIPDYVPDAAANIVCKVRQVRDACILLAGHRCYREYPVHWVEEQIKREDNMDLRETKHFPILYRHATICKQIQVGRSKLRFLSHDLAESMGTLLDDLAQQSLDATTKSSNGRIQLGFDYVVTAEKH